MERRLRRQEREEGRREVLSFLAFTWLFAEFSVNAFFRTPDLPLQP